MSTKFSYPPSFSWNSQFVLEENGKNVLANMKQYNLEDKYLGVVRFDHSHHDVFVNRPLFDAIVTDRMDYIIQLFTCFSCDVKFSFLFWDIKKTFLTLVCSAIWCKSWRQEGWVQERWIRYPCWQPPSRVCYVSSSYLVGKKAKLESHMLPSSSSNMTLCSFKSVPFLPSTRGPS